MKRAIETTGTVDADGQLHLDVPEAPLEAGRVRVLLLFEDTPTEDTPSADLRTRGMEAGEAAELRRRLLPFADEWNSPEMSIYDDYDAARSQTR